MAEVYKMCEILKSLDSMSHFSPTKIEYFINCAWNLPQTTQSFSSTPFMSVCEICGRSRDEYNIINTVYVR